MDGMILGDCIEEKVRNAQDGPLEAQILYFVSWVERISRRRLKRPIRKDRMQYKRKGHHAVKEGALKKRWNRCDGACLGPQRLES